MILRQREPPVVESDPTVSNEEGPSADDVQVPDIQNDPEHQTPRGAEKNQTVKETRLTSNFNDTIINSSEGSYQQSEVNVTPISSKLISPPQRIITPEDIRPIPCVSGIKILKKKGNMVKQPY